ncbi:transmembrane protein 40-like isoform 1 [Cricetulus griseus]|nr:transmembrane protein 40-like isoform 1 [Cricetulus griseus]
MEASGSSSQSEEASGIHRETENLNCKFIFSDPLSTASGDVGAEWTKRQSSTSKMGRPENDVRETSLPPHPPHPPLPLPHHLPPPPQTAAMRTSTPEAPGNTEGSPTGTALPYPFSGEHHHVCAHRFSFHAGDSGEMVLAGESGLRRRGSGSTGGEMEASQLRRLNIKKDDEFFHFVLLCFAIGALLVCYHYYADWFMSLGVGLLTFASLETIGIYFGLVYRIHSVLQGFIPLLQKFRLPGILKIDLVPGGGVACLQPPNRQRRRREEEGEEDNQSFSGCKHLPNDLSLIPGTLKV